MQDPQFTDSLAIPSRHLVQNAGVMPEVYSWLFPPVRAKITEFMADYPMDVFLQNVSPGLDDAHNGLFETFEAVHPEIRGLDGFDWKYPMCGSSEGIFHLLTFVGQHYGDLPLYVLDHEYKGFGALAASLGMKMISLSEEALADAKPGVLFVSNPSSRDGNVIETDLLDALIRRHKTIIDLAYVGLTKPFDLDLNHENILAVITSMSKPFGLYYFRVGMMWSRQEIPSLYSTKWFKNLHGIFLAEKVLADFEGSLYDWVAVRQANAIKIINEQWKTDFVASDVGILAVANSVPDNLDLDIFKRGGFYRVCLTPLMMKLEGDTE